MMSEDKKVTVEKHQLTTDEKFRLDKTRANDAEVDKETKDVISKHLNAIKELAKR